jgi:hypothetical protein
MFRLLRALAVMGGILASSSAVKADTNLNTPRVAFSFHPTERVADFPEVAFHVGRCRVHDARVTIRSDGSASWEAIVSTREGHAVFGTRLNFVHQGGTFTFTFIRVDVGPQRVTWERHNLGIPKHLFNSIVSVFRNDHCDD